MNTQTPINENLSVHTGEGFDGLGIAPLVMQFLDRVKFHTPTPIQKKAIPPAIEGKDIMGIAQTGTGKTLAFAIPVVQRLARGKKETALILVPTRELAVQVDETVKKIASVFKIRTAVLIGGASMHNQIREVRQGARIIIATPGRLMDHLEQRTVNLRDTVALVLDEADRMLDMGFQPQIESIIKRVPAERQTLLFSATMPQEILRIASRYMKLPVQVEIAPSGRTAEKVTQELFIVARALKDTLMEKLLRQYRGSVLVFSRTKIGAYKLTKKIRAAGHQAAEIHSDRSLGQRREALEGFKSGKYRVLVATDIAARGIDVTGIEAVINYDLPEDAENYVHRIGRTGRAGHQGHAISLATPEQHSEVQAIERLTKIPIPVSQHADVPAESFPKVSPSATRRSFGRRPRRPVFMGRRRHR